MKYLIHIKDPSVFLRKSEVTLALQIYLLKFINKKGYSKELMPKKGFYIVSEEEFKKLQDTDNVESFLRSKADRIVNLGLTVGPKNTEKNGEDLQ